MGKRQTEVLELVERHRLPICDGCIEKKLSYPVKQVNPINNAFMKECIIECALGIECCLVCCKCNYDNSLSGK